MRYLKSLFLIFITPTLLFCQSVKLSDREDFFFRQENQTVFPEDYELGFLETRKEFREPFLFFISDGANLTNSLSDSIILLNKKFQQFGLASYDSYRITLSEKEKTSESYRASFRIDNEYTKIKGTYYLRKYEDKWFLYDVEIESQAISSP